MAHQPIELDVHDITITPVFRHESIEDINASEREGTLQKKVLTVVEVRFAGTDRYQPVFPVEAHWQFQNGRSITYGERWASQYNAFLAGSDQKAQGTPLEMLRPYGISDSQLSLCRALKIYSIEALHAVDGQAKLGLQMSGNALKEMAKKFIDARSARNMPADEVVALRAELEEMRLLLAKTVEGQTVVTEPVPMQEELDAATAQANAELAANDQFTKMDDDQLKAFIKDKTGSAPRGQPGRPWLLNAAREASAA